MQVVTIGTKVWVPTGDPDQWREWQYIPNLGAHMFLGVVHSDRLDYVASRYTLGLNPNS